MTNIKEILERPFYFILFSGLIMIETIIVVDRCLEDGVLIGKLTVQLHFPFEGQLKLELSDQSICLFSFLLSLIKLQAPIKLNKVEIP